jgi:enoyl reductase-like protein
MRTDTSTIRKHRKISHKSAKKGALPNIAWMDIPVSRIIRKLSSPHETKRKLTVDESLKLENVLFNLGLYKMDMEKSETFRKRFTKRFQTNNRFHCGVVVSLLLLYDHNPLDPISPFHRHVDTQTSDKIDTTLEALGSQVIKILGK